MTGFEAVLRWVSVQAGTADAIAAVDAPLVITNPTGVRAAERALNAEFQRFHAGCHPANQSRPFAPALLAFKAAMEQQGFHHRPCAAAQSPGRYQIEVHPHAAAVALFQLPLILKYKRGPRASRAKALRRYRRLLKTVLPALEPPLTLACLPSIPLQGDLKPVEDQLDAVLCAYLAAYWWHGGLQRSCLFGDEENGGIVVPRLFCLTANPSRARKSPVLPEAAIE